LADPSKSTPATSPEVIGFLRSHAPFDNLDAVVLDRVAAAVEIQQVPAGAVILAEGTTPVEHLWVVADGAVEIVHEGRVLDLLGEGEVFGHASMLSGLPTGFEARAAEDAVCYRIPADAAQELLTGPAGLRYVTRSLLESAPEVMAATAEPAREVSSQPVRSLLHAGPVICSPETEIRAAAQQMAAAGVSSVVVDLGGGKLGILTDHDLRDRVVAAGVAHDVPVSRVMSAPAYTCRPDRLGGEVLLEMLDRGFRHYPVVTASGRILGVIEDRDLVAVQTRSSFFLRQRIGRAASVDDLVRIAAELGPMVVSLYDARVSPTNITAVYAVAVDALTRRLLELTVAERGEPAARFAWLALGSQARREATPGSDVDSAIVWFGPDDEAAVRPSIHAIAEEVIAGLQRCGLSRDAHDASADNPIFVRSLQSWQRAGRSWIEDPTQEKALILVSVLVDSRPVWGVHTGTPVSDTFRLAPDKSALLRLLARFALSHRPPTGFFRGLVVEHSGEHRGLLDLKHGGLLPIVDLARWAGMAAGVTSATTLERLRSAAMYGTLSETDANTLRDAFELITGLRLEHQVTALRAGQPPDDHIDPRDLGTLTRNHLREAFRAVAAIQRRVGNEMRLGTR
jgi:CBS domain-containing protein